ncbi:MAG: hypothetical protein A2Y60_05855 [Chloroflexi bacterium RBG_13_54_9]|nr:MAG: hypothetical protein A2Y60_05855 [Chloroflexi bacterium RBG_13_54_9]
MRGLLTDALRESLETDASVGQRLFQVSNPCWYRYELLTFEQPTPNNAAARVRIYQHWWPGDNAGGPPWSLEQDIVLVATATGWRIDQLGPWENRRDEPNEPHGPTTSACNVAKQPKE